MVGPAATDSGTQYRQRGHARLCTARSGAGAFRGHGSPLDAPVRVATTVSGHLGGSRRPTEFVEREQRDATDATPAGNAVDLEEEMAKMNETAASHKLTTQLYRKYLGLIRMAASARD